MIINTKPMKLITGEICKQQQWSIHLRYQQQGQSHRHSQVSVSKEQHEHPVWVQSRHQREPAEQKKHQREKFCRLTSSQSARRICKIRSDTRKKAAFSHSLDSENRIKCTTTRGIPHTVNTGINAQLRENYKSVCLLERSWLFLKGNLCRYERSLQPILLLKALDASCCRSTGDRQL